MGLMRKDIADFEVRTEPGRSPTKPIRITRCKACGWETRARNSSLYGRDGELDRQKIAHRLAHLEGRA